MVIWSQILAGNFFGRTKVCVEKNCSADWRLSGCVEHQERMLWGLQNGGKFWSEDSLISRDGSWVMADAIVSNTSFFTDLQL